jgi:hypothetical protein
MSYENTSGRGVLAHYGPRTVNENYGAILNAGGRRKQLIQTITNSVFPVLPATDAGGLNAFIPAGCTIVEAYFKVDTAFTGSSGVFDIGLELQDGTEVDDDGLYDGLLLADIDSSLGVTLLSSQATVVGASLGAQTTANTYLKVAIASGAFTAGAATITVDYIQS